jgi:tetratricopeptide (TPR) repeat protein
MKKITLRKFAAIFVVVTVAKILLLTGLLAYFGLDRDFVVNEIYSQVQAIETSNVEFNEPGVSYSLPASTWIPQTFNNCGPAATSMVLQHFGFNVSQEETKSRLRTNSEDKNIFTYQISDYLKDFRIESKVFYNGDLKTLKTLVSNGFYVVVEDFLHPNDDIGHVLIIRGYDDNEGVLIADDSYFGVGIKYPYSTWDEHQWKVFNREFMPVYSHEKEETLKAIMGENWREKKMYENSIEKNQKDVELNPNDVYAWFNLGTSYYALGDYQSAKTSFERSRILGWPMRMLWYQIEPVQTYNKLGLFSKAIELANKGLAGNYEFAEMHFEKAIAYRGLGDMEKAEAEIAITLSMDPNFDTAPFAH